ncbi:MAG: histone deacetylase [Desulfosarcina sp.]|nr:histone deacetylase [Desulfobacterales bacterium]
MILYDATYKTSFFEFGIQIPISDSKLSRTFDILRNHPLLGSRRQAWHCDRVTEKIEETDLRRAHSGAYVERLFSEALENEIVKTYELIDAEGRYYRYNPSAATQPLTGLFDRIRQRVAGTAQCCRRALENGFCFYFGGGMHHAQYDFGNGFCLLNDIVIAIRKLQAENSIHRAWVIDVDAHKGDGTAALTRGDDTITTLSIHMARGWPLDGNPVLADGRPNPSFIPSDIDIPIAAGEESDYNAQLLEGLYRLEARSQPELAVVVSGADPYEKDELPSTQELRLSRSQMRDRDRLVYRFLNDRGIPHAGLMAGGYGKSVWEIYSRFLTWVLCDRLGGD